MHYDDDMKEWEFDIIHQSRRPLRWIANLCGTMATSGILDAYMENEGHTGFRYKFNLWKWDTFWPIYNKYGTFYKLKTEKDYLD